MAESADEKPTRLQRVKETLDPILGKVFWRHVASICIAFIITAVPTAFTAGVIWTKQDERMTGLQNGLDDHSSVLKEINSRIWPIERSLADGTGPLTIKTQGEDIKDLKSFVAEQRRLNGVLETQNAATATAIDKVQDTVGELQTDVRAILNNLRNRSGPP